MSTQYLNFGGYGSGSYEVHLDNVVKGDTHDHIVKVKAANLRFPTPALLCWESCPFLPAGLSRMKHFCSTDA